MKRMIIAVTIIFAISLFFVLQSLFSLIWMLYAWEDPKYANAFRSPKNFAKPKLSFTALVPARFEEKVIKDTLIALSQIDYPEELKEVLVLCREDDKKTIKKVESILKNRRRNVKMQLVVFNSGPINKPHSLNIGLYRATKDVIVVFDAEDRPHKDIYAIANTIFSQKDISILQSGVQLINYQSRWFSVFNVLEYYFWFKSGLHFFSNIGHVTPLAGNTVFFKKKLLFQVNGWDEYCLTEDAEIGFRLLSQGGKVGVVYDERHVTFEETPVLLKDFIQQRTRWNQGFLQVFAKMEWLKLSSPTQQILSLYILLSPVMQFLLILYTPFALWVFLFYKIPVTISFFSFLPLYLFFLQLCLYLIGFFEFNKSYKLHAPLLTYVVIAVAFFPYQILLTFSALRACYRVLLGENHWEKTEHVNMHRNFSFGNMPY